MRIATNPMQLSMPLTKPHSIQSISPYCTTQHSSSLPSSSAPFDTHSRACLDRILNSIIARLPNLGLKVQINQLALLRRPFAVCIPVENQLIRASIADLDGRMAQRSICRPVDSVACGLGDQEGFCASLVPIAVDAFLDGVIHDGSVSDFAGCDCLLLCV